MTDKEGRNLAVLIRWMVIKSLGIDLKEDKGGNFYLELNEYGERKYQELKELK